MSTATEIIDAGIEARDRIARRSQKKQSVRIIQAALLRHALRDDDHSATANDVREQVEDLCSLAGVELDHHDYGSSVIGLRMMGVIESLGYAQASTSPRAQGNRVRRWRVVDPQRAAQIIVQLQEPSCHTR